MSAVPLLCARSILSFIGAYFLFRLGFWDYGPAASLSAPGSEPEVVAKDTVRMRVGRSSQPAVLLED